MNNLRPMGQTPPPQLGRRSQQIQKPQPVIISTSNLASVRLTDKIIMGEMTVAIAKTRCGRGIHKI